MIPSGACNVRKVFYNWALCCFQMSGPPHKHRYKNAGLDSQELRRRREEEGVQLRKQKREQQLFKKRNVISSERIDDDQVFGVLFWGHNISHGAIQYLDFNS